MQKIIIIILLSHILIACKNDLIKSSESFYDNDSLFVEIDTIPHDQIIGTSEIEMADLGKSCMDSVLTICPELKKIHTSFDGKGEIILASGVFLYEYKDKNITIKYLINEQCELKARTIINKQDTSMSITKYDNNYVVYFDSANSQGDMVCYYIKGAKQGLSDLPEYICAQLKDSCPD